jgi:hypothetical protein
MGYKQKQKAKGAKGGATAKAKKSPPLPGLDVHAWVQHDGTKKILDTTQIPLALLMSISVMRRVEAYEGRRTMVYQQYPEGQALESVRAAWSAIRRRMVGEAMGGEATVFQAIRDNHYALPNMCLANTEAWLADHPDSGYSLRIGCAGWRRQDGSTWWEWGDPDALLPASAAAAS